jgi:hypothetical protein
MREILFRAKSCVGNWVFGFLKKQLVGGEPDMWAIQTEAPPDAPLITAKGPLHLYENVVDPATIGQYTGVNDKRGTRIFEGDLILFDGDGEDADPCEVRFSVETGSWVYSCGAEWDFLGGDGQGLTVVGNVFQSR